MANFSLTAVILFLLLASVAASGPVLTINGKEAIYKSRPRKYADAEAYCKSIDMQVVYDMTNETQKAMMSVIEQSGLTVWIGLTDCETEGQWVAKTPFGDKIYELPTYFWDKGEPNEFKGEDCLMMRPNGRLNDCSCDMTLSFFCI